MQAEQLFLHHKDVTPVLRNRGLSLEGLREEYRIGHYDRKVDPFLDNFFLMCSDDSGTPCLIHDQYRDFLKKLKALKFNAGDRGFVNSYLESRVTFYESPRRGRCVGMRGSSYYSMIEHRDNELLFQVLKRDLIQDTKMFSFLARTQEMVPKEFQSLVIEHLKHAFFRVMFAYIRKSVREEDFFDLTTWTYLDSSMRTLWEIFIRVLLQPGYQIESTISFNRLFEILELVKDQDFTKLQELDSAKTLLRFADSLMQQPETFKYCIPLLYGGVEIPYAVYAYGVLKKRHLFQTIVPALFSLNRMKKGTLEPSLLRETDGLIREEMLGKIIPRHFLEAMRLSDDKSVLIVDNNITTGYSVSILSDSLKSIHLDCHVAVAEVNVQEIKGIAEGLARHKSKSVVIRGSELHAAPVGEYVTCFGVYDASRVVNRVNLLLGKGTYKQVEGYDFDGTLFKTGYIHRKTWNSALLRFGIEFDVIDLPSNSGLTYNQAALNIYTHLQSEGFKIPMSAEKFVQAICKEKIMLMRRWPTRDIIPIAKTVNLVRADLSNTKLVVTNNNLAVVKSFLNRKGLLHFFSHLICADYAYAVRSKEKVLLTNRPKPEIAAYIEASEYFQIPMMQRYYGDDKVIDSKFAERLECDFSLVAS